MRNISLLLALLMLLASCSVKQTNNKDILAIQTDTSDATNDFFDNAEVHQLITLNSITIDGEIDNPGIIDFTSLPLQSVIVKETLLSENEEEFVGAYRYYGYSLYDILNNAKINKKNKNEFKPIVDLYIEIENDKGEKVKLSWGEIYFPNHLKEIMIATKVMRIIPTKSRDMWKLPTDSKLIIPSDLLTERNISNPVKITVKSYPKSFETIKGLKPLYSPTIDFYNNDTKLETLTENPTNLQNETLHTIFYGRGRGLHSTKPFTGVYLKEYLAKHIELNLENIRNGLVSIVAKDGYRVVYSFSEIMNRNDQSEVLLLCNPEVKDNGIFRVFPICDFFSDRAIKGIDRIYFSVNN